MLNLLRSLFGAARSILMTRRDLTLENLALRRQEVGGLHHRYVREAA